MSKTLNRRHFLTKSGAALGAFGLGSLWTPTIARAAEASNRYFVFCYFEGGWDHLLGLDPRDPAEFTDAILQETQIQPAYDRLPAQFSRQVLDAGPFTLGPCATALAPLADRLALVRGINMNTLTHEVGRRYFNTGQAPAGLRARGNSVAALATDQLGGADTAVPNLTHRVESYADGLASYAAAMQVAAVGHLRYVLQDSLGIPTFIGANVKDALAEYYARKRACSPATGVSGTQAAQLYRENRTRGKELVQSTLYQSFEFDQPSTAEVRAHYGIDPYNPETAAGRAALAAQAIKSGLSRVVSVALSTSLDTHGQEWAQDHPPRLQEGFDAFARLIEDLESSEAPGGGSMLDCTTVVAYSEFGRTARLNPQNGRDHLLTNCALLAGGGIKTGQVIGRSSDRGLEPELIDLLTGQVSDTGISLKPEHVLTTVLHAAGLDASALRSEPIPALLG